MNSVLAQVGFSMLSAGLAYAGAAAISIPIIIHLLTRYRRQRQAWGAMRFLLEAFKKQRTRLRMEQLILLLVRCMVLGILGFALAGPILSGCTSGMLKPIAQSGRVIVLVLDDSLSTRTQRPVGDTRFDMLQKQALQLIDALHENDRVMVWRASRPAEGLVVHATNDHDAARSSVTNMQPRYSSSDLPGALRDVAGALDDPAVRISATDQVMVVVLSDFAAGTLNLESAVSTRLEALSRRVDRLFVSSPMDERTNVQIASFVPRRHMVLAGSESQRVDTVAMELTLRRFAEDSADRLTGYEVSVLDEQGNAVVTRQREHRWSAGQTEAVINLDVPLRETSAARGTPQGDVSGTSVSIRARLDHSSSGDTDALSADNIAWTVVQWRDALRIAVVDDPAGNGLMNRDDAKIPPQRWLSVSLAPFDMLDEAGSHWPIRTVDLPAAEITSEQLSALDAVMVLRPDELSDRGWKALSEFAQAGGLVWVFVPPQGDGASAAWGPRMTEAFRLDWRIGLELLEADSDELLRTQELNPDAVQTERAWSLVNDSDFATVPEPLRMLAADWAMMLRPIRVYQRIGLEMRQNEGEQQSVWLKLNDAQQSPLLATAEVGDGRVLLLTTALDTDWTNLPTKPFFVPLVHETLRGVLGESPRLRRLSTTLAGDQPQLDHQWIGAERLVLRHALTASPRESSVMLQRNEQGLVTSSSVIEPGVYGAAPEPAGWRMVVNVDAKAGDTRQIDQSRLELWLNNVHPQWSWLDMENPAVTLATEPNKTNLAWILLWAVVLLVAVETMLARWFSHAKTQSQSTMAQLAGAVRKLHKPT